MRPSEASAVREQTGPILGEYVNVEAIVPSEEPGSTVLYLRFDTGAFCPVTLPTRDYQFFERVEAPSSDGQELLKELGAEAFDWEAAFAPSWTLSMDSALVQYASERAMRLGRTVTEIKLTELLDADVDADVDGGEAQVSADAVALTRGASSHAPCFTPRSLCCCAPLTSANVRALV